MPCDWAVQCKLLEAIHTGVNIAMELQKKGGRDQCHRENWFLSTTMVTTHLCGEYVRPLQNTENGQLRNIFHPEDKHPTSGFLHITSA